VKQRIAAQPKKIVIPAKAGTQGCRAPLSTLVDISPLQPWTPAFAGRQRRVAVDTAPELTYNTYFTGDRPSRGRQKRRKTVPVPSKLRKSHQPPAPPAAPPLPERVEARLAALAAEAECADLAEGAGDPEIAAGTVRQLMAHQLAAGHGLAMGLTGRARRLVRECAAEAGSEDTGRRSLELLRFVAGTARMMERCRAAAIALDRIGYPEMPEGPDDDGPHRCEHPHHYAWRLSNERTAERRRVLDWIAQGKKASEMPGVDDWPPYHNPDMPDMEKLDRRLAAAPLRAAPDVNRGRLKNGNPPGDYLAAPRCGAKTRAGACCRQPAMRNGRCRFHGGKSTGPRTAAGLQRSRAARLVHGFRTAEIIDLRSAAARTSRSLRALTSIAQQKLPTSPSLLSPRKRGPRDAERPWSGRVDHRTLKPWTPAFAGEESLQTAVSNVASSAGHGVRRSDSRRRWIKAKALRRAAG
jgi:hypothetical protein